MESIFKKIRNLNMFCLKINSYTDKMFNIMKENSSSHLWITEELNPS